MPRLARSLFATFAFLLIASPAAAQQVSFTVSGGFDAFWTLPASPTPDVDFGDAFRLDDVNLIYNGANETVDMEFYGAGGGGGACAGFACGLFNLFGDVLYEEPSSAPTFIVGSYNMFDDVTQSEVLLEIERVVAGVPEPTTAVLLVVGLAGVALAGRRRRADALG